MKTRLLILVVILIAASQACTANPATQTVLPPMPTDQSAATQVPVESTPVSFPTDTAQPEPTVEPTAVSQPAVVTLVSVGGAGPTVTLADAHTGEPVATFPAPGLNETNQAFAVTDGIVYKNDDGTLVKEAKTDGSTRDLEFMNPERKFLDAAIMPSSDGTRIAWGAVDNVDQSDNSLNVVLKTANVDGSGVNDLLVENRKEWFRPQPWQWSADGQSLYFSNVMYGIGGYILFGGGTDLQKIDLASHAITEIVPQRNCLCPTTLSPDETLVAYLDRTDAGQVLHIREVNGGADRSLPMDSKYAQAGSILWSPDGASLVLTLAVGDYEKEAYSVVKVDVQTLALQVLVPDDTRLLQTQVWPVQDVIWLDDASHNVWRLDPVSGTLTQAGSGQILIRSHW